MVAAMCVSMDVTQHTVSLYDVLGVSPSASVSDIRSAFRKAVAVNHPDHAGSGDEFASQRFILIRQAYEVLSDVQSRGSYDQELVRLAATADSQFSSPEPAASPSAPYKTYGADVGQADLSVVWEAAWLMAASPWVLAALISFSIAVLVWLSFAQVSFL